MTASVVPGGRRPRRERPRSRATFASVLGELLLTAGVVVLLFVAWQMWIGDIAAPSSFFCALMMMSPTHICHATNSSTITPAVSSSSPSTLANVARERGRSRRGRRSPGTTDAVMARFYLSELSRDRGGTTGIGMRLGQKRGHG